MSDLYDIEKYTNLIGELNKSINVQKDFFETMQPPYHMYNKKLEVLWVCKYNENNTLTHCFIKHGHEPVIHEFNNLDQAKRLLYNLRLDGYLPIMIPETVITQGDDNGIKLPYR